jgi:hypothetical protein
VNARREIQQMRRDVDALAKKPAPGDPKVFIVTHPQDGHMKLHMRRLHVGEPRRRGDLWLDPQTNQLVPLIVPWWRRYGVVTDKHVDHFRILP